MEILVETHFIFAIHIHKFKQLEKTGYDTVLRKCFVLAFFIVRTVIPFTMRPSGNITDQARIYDINQRLWHLNNK